MYDPDALARAHASSFTTSLNRVYNFTYGWMAFGLLISGVVAYFMAQAFGTEVLVPSRGLFMGCFIVEILLVLGLSAMIHKMAVPLAALLFMVYAAVNGVTLSVIFLVFELATIQSVFFVTAGTFAGMALFGSLTRKNLSGMGRICVMGLWGIILASFVNIFLGSSGLDAIVTYGGVLIFVGLTAWDAQKVRILAEQQNQLDAGTVRRLGLLCALELYLDFINLFLYLLRFFGGKGRD
jgi:FtsH-binding integral membrane protein